MTDDVPAAIKRQQEDAEKRRKAAYENPDTPEEGARQDGGDNDPPPADDPANQPAADDPPAPSDPPDGGGDGDTDDTTDWKAAYERLDAQHQTLRGKYDSEVPRLSRQLREANEENERLQNQLAQASTAAPTAAGTGDEELDRKIEEARTEWGDDLIETLTLVARRMVDQRTDERIKPLSEQMGQINERQETSDRDRFLASLKAQVPNWQAINADPKFHTWLAETDPLTGRERQAALNDAHGRLDADQVARIFNLYLKESGQAEPAEESRRNAELERQVDPSGRRTAPPPPQEPKVYTKADMDQLEREMRRGEITEAQYRERMGEIQKAISEGRYRPT